MVKRLIFSVLAVFALSSNASASHNEIDLKYSSMETFNTYFKDGAIWNFEESPNVIENSNLNSENR